jgi:hypothetical protein
MSAADFAIDQRILTGTKKGYRSKLTTMTIYLMQRGFYNLIDESNKAPVVPLPHDVIKDMFGWLSTKRTPICHSEKNETSCFSRPEHHWKRLASLMGVKSK